jgi:hypothetical protein
MDPEQAGLVEGLVARSPGLDALLAQHRDANSGATLPFVYFGLVASWASDKAARVAHDEELTAVLH